MRLRIHVLPVQVFVDFFAEWCGPCKQVAPKLEAYAKQYPDVTFLKVDVDNDATSELSSKNGISAMPTFIAFLNGEEVGKVVGANLGKMEELIKKCGPGLVLQEQPVPCLASSPLRARCAGEFARLSDVDVLVAPSLRGKLHEGHCIAQRAASRQSPQCVLTRCAAAAGSASRRRRPLPQRKPTASVSLWHSVWRVSAAANVRTHDPLPLAG